MQAAVVAADLLCVTHGLVKKHVEMYSNYVLSLILQLSQYVSHAYCPGPPITMKIYQYGSQLL